VNVTWGLTAKEPGSAPCPTLVIDYKTTLLLCLDGWMLGWMLVSFRCRYTGIIGAVHTGEKVCNLHQFACEKVKHKTSNTLWSVWSHSSDGRLCTSCQLSVVAAQFANHHHYDSLTPVVDLNKSLSLTLCTLANDKLPVLLHQQDTNQKKWNSILVINENCISSSVEKCTKMKSRMFNQ